MATQTLAGKPFRAIAVLGCKPALNPTKFDQKDSLYTYLCCSLIERISWLCRDLRPQTPEGDGRVQIVFARHGGMSYGEFKDYLEGLRSSSGSEVKISWPVIHIAGIEARDQSERYGLQIADLVTSGINAALEPDFYGNTEPRFARMLKTNIYCRGTNYLHHGAKLVPHVIMPDRIPHVSSFREIFERGERAVPWPVIATMRLHPGGCSG